EWFRLTLSLELTKVVAVPGARVFKPDWIEAVIAAGCRVVMAYDADEDGDTYSAKFGRQLAQAGLDVKFVRWPETVPAGYDLRDYLTQSVGSPKKTWLVLRSRIGAHRRPALFGDPIPAK